MGYFFLAPIMIFYSMFFVYPVLFSLLASTRRWNMLVPLSNARKIGFSHYSYLLNDEMFVSVFRNTLIYALLTVSATIIIALILAVLINGARFSVLWRFIYFTPVVTPQVAIGTIWGYLYRPNNGLLNSILGLFGMKPVYWLTDPDIALLSIIIAAIWSGIGGSMLIITAGLRNIPKDYYDAAKIDGAGPFKQFFHITVPLLSPTLLFLTATGFIGAWQVFDLPFTMGRNAPAKSVMTVSWYVYETAFQSLRMGRASAGAFLLFCVIFSFTLVILWIFKRGGIKGYE
ncbi:MAG: multiple sugar transport system permease protein [Pseudothermotoga sp.]|nr:MAG: Binding-protein-dependent transport systems inner membrane component [Pseudothermotoga lettingae]MDI3495041.1 multiple sugar transport system permease protein [Pseudothermotoga sp.]MDK2885203.1 multiple sugar transport system permease protein [Pseudothermotoga sp.]